MTERNDDARIVPRTNVSRRCRSRRTVGWKKKKKTKTRPLPAAQRTSWRGAASVHTPSPSPPRRRRRRQSDGGSGLFPKVLVFSFSCFQSRLVDENRSFCTAETRLGFAAIGRRVHTHIYIAQKIMFQCSASSVGIMKSVFFFFLPKKINKRVINNNNTRFAFYHGKNIRTHTHVFIYIFIYESRAQLNSYNNERKNNIVLLHVCVCARDVHIQKTRREENRDEISSYGRNVEIVFFRMVTYGAQLAMVWGDLRRIVLPRILRNPSPQSA